METIAFRWLCSNIIMSRNRTATGPLALFVASIYAALALGHFVPSLSLEKLDLVEPVTPNVYQALGLNVSEGAVSMLGECQRCY